MLRRFAVLAAVLVPLAVPAVASAHGTTGVVVKIDRHARMLAVSRAQARVALVHATRVGRFQAGQRVRMQTRTLRDGTLAASSVVVVGQATSVSIRGTVIGESGGFVTISAGGATFTLPDEHAGGLAVGSDVLVTLKFEGGKVEVESIEPAQAQAPVVSVEGRLTIGAGTITVAKGDVSVMATVPSGFDLSGFQTGDEVLASFAVQPDGSFLLSKLSREDVNEDQRAQAGNKDDDNQADDEGEGDGDHGPQSAGTPSTDHHDGGGGEGHDHGGDSGS